MIQIGAQEFVSRLKESLHSGDSRFSWFLGAGCSVTSGIPTAAGLVRIWLRRLKKHKTGSEEHSEGWATKIFPGYDSNNAALFYGQVIEQLFLSPLDRQQEIERIVAGRDPGFGYAVLAQLISHVECGKRCNIVLTTNFDDLVADALYLYTRRKPLVIVHESLVGFVRMGRTDPTIIKLHGDARLEPRNIETETEELDKAVKKVIVNLLSETGLIFIGYGGNDKSIVDLLDGLPRDKPPWPVYWIRDAMPGEQLAKLLTSRNAIWVKHRDFDELMLLIRHEFDLKHPERERFDGLFKGYFETFKTLKGKVEARPESDEKKTFESAVQDAVSQLGSCVALVLGAEKLKETDPEKANVLYEEAVRDFPESALALGSYAIFLDTVLKDYDKAQQYYTRAVEADPNDKVFVGYYATFLLLARRDYEKAGQYFKRLAEVAPEAVPLSSYGVFLTIIRKDYDTAEDYFYRGIEADPNNAFSLSSYAFFLSDIRKQHDRAEYYHKMAIRAKPDNTISLTSYGNFLWQVRKMNDQAESFYKKAIDIDPKDPNVLTDYAGFLLGNGMTEVGFRVVSTALGLVSDLTDLELVCRFYEYAHTRDERTRGQSLQRIRELIRASVRCHGWRSEYNIERAIGDRHPHPQFLKTLAKVISDEVDAKELDKFGEWKESS